MEQANPDASFETISNIFTLFGLDINTINNEIRRELVKYEQYAKTDEGQKIIYDQFTSKLAGVNSVGAVIDRLEYLYEQFCLDDIDEDTKAIIGSGLLFFIMSTDVIPDYVFSIGFLDDVIAVNLVMKRLSDLG